MFVFQIVTRIVMPANFSGFCEPFNIENRRKRELFVKRLNSKKIQKKRPKREDLLIKDDILKRSYKTKLR